jgi:CHASE3 domain sensor protein
MKRSHVLAAIVHSSLTSIVNTFSMLCIVLVFASFVFAQTPEESPTVVTTTKAVERAKSDVESVNTQPRNE